MMLNLERKDGNNVVKDRIKIEIDDELEGLLRRAVASLEEMAKSAMDDRKVREW